MKETIAVPITVRRAFHSQDTLLNQPEHCSVDPEHLASIGRSVDHQVRIWRNDKEYALYTVSEIWQENPGHIVRMAQNARRRLKITGEFNAVLDAQVPHQTFSDVEAEANSEFVERLTDNGSHRGLIAIAPHGGMIEEWTDHQAERVSAKLVGQGVSCWRCKGWKRGGGTSERWHITSTDIHEASFPLLNTIIDRGFTDAVAFHGFDRNEINNFDVLIGGRARLVLKEEIQFAIKNAIPDPGIRVVIATPEMNLSGSDRRNIVNRLTTNHNGVQIEQSKQARQGFWKEIADAVIAVFSDRLTSFSFDQTKDKNAVI